jgi:hypothetical protein
MYGVAGQQRVPDDFLRDLPVLVPPLEEQRRIAGFLGAETSGWTGSAAPVTLRAGCWASCWDSASTEPWPARAKR